MTENIQKIYQEALAHIVAAGDTQDLEKLRVHYLGKKGLLTSMLHQLKTLSPDERRSVGAVVNEVKSSVELKLEARRVELEKVQIEKELSQSGLIDVTLPGHYPVRRGSFHPVSQVIQQATAHMKRLGFSVVNGPEIELESNNFESLNIPAHHPARDMQQTFHISREILLRSHTSPVQIRTMRRHAPPLKVIAVGKVYRSDYDMTHTPMFHQMEGLMVDENVSFSELKGTLHYLVRSLFGTKNLRFRPSYFPFTEPSAEVDMECFLCKGNNSTCRMCKGTGWLEIGGCGMVHPNVFKAVEYNPDRYTGFAFGMGIERIAMLKYGIDDLRSLFENDIRMLEQF